MEGEKKERQADGERARVERKERKNKLDAPQESQLPVQTTLWTSESVTKRDSFDILPSVFLSVAGEPEGGQ